MCKELKMMNYSKIKAVFIRRRWLSHVEGRELA
jgi:hypothetical protein